MTTSSDIITSTLQLMWHSALKIVALCGMLAGGVVILVVVAACSAGVWMRDAVRRLL